MPQLSICIPTYNRAPRLAATLSTLCNIKWPFASEIVVCDNASTDDTPRVLSNYPVRQVRHTVTIHPIENHFSVLRAARGEYAFYLGDDDDLLPDALARAVTSMNANPELVAAYSPYIETTDASGQNGFVANSLTTSAFAFAKGNFLAALRFFMERAMYHPETPLIRSEVFRRFVTTPRKMWYAYWMFASLLKRGPIGMFSESVWIHRSRASFQETPQLQWTLAVDEQDKNRLGFEYIAYLARIQNGGQLPDDIARSFHEFLARRFSEYGQIAAKISEGLGEFQGATEFLVRPGLWQGADLKGRDLATIELRVEAEIARRQVAHPGHLTVVESAAERLSLLANGIAPDAVVSREDLRQALSVA
jgi:glycosyltransferase involved in cell wall biosynthesis